MSRAIFCAKDFCRRARKNIFLLFRQKSTTTNDEELVAASWTTEPQPRICHEDSCLIDVDDAQAVLATARGSARHFDRS